MHYWRNPLWVKITLLFFTSFLLHQPAYAGQSVSEITVSSSLQKTEKLPVFYVSETQAWQAIRDYQRRGYTVQQASLAQFNQLLLASNETSSPAADVVKPDKVPDKIGELTTGCEKPVKPAQRAGDGQKDTDQKNVSSNKPGPGEDKDKNGDNADTRQKNAGCDTTNITTESADAPATQQESRPETTVTTEPLPVPVPEPVPQPLPPPQGETHTSVGVYGDVYYGSGGNSSDAAKVFFILAGIMVVGVFIVFAGKYIADIVRGEKKDIWWELIFNSTFLGTGSDEHGRFSGVRIATGFVSSDLFQVALVGEVGNTDLKLVLDESVSSSVLNITGSYWMLGASARLHLTDKLVNASYLYLDFMGGSTDHSETDVIGAARMGASFGINDYVRLGASFGAQYVGLDESQGFVNDADNYWFTYGIEVGVRF